MAKLRFVTEEDFEGKSARGRDTRVFLDGQDITNSLSFIRLEAGPDSYVTAELHVLVDDLEIDLPADVTVVDSKPPIGLD